MATPETNRPTSRIPAKLQPVERDPLTAMKAIGIALAMAVPVIVGRMHQREAISIAAVLAVLILAWPVDRVEGTKRTTLGTAGWVLAEYIVAVAWPWGHWWALVPVALVPYGIIVIGAGMGTTKRLVAKVDASVPAVIRQQLPQGAKVEPQGRHANGKVRYRIKAGTDTPKGGMANVDLKVATVLKRPRGDVQLVDLGDQQAGLFELVISEDRPFAFEPVTRPDEWPPGAFPLGWEGEGLVVWIESGLHGIVAGETGSGKSNTLNVIIGAAHRHGRQLILVDPKTTELWPWQAHAIDGGGAYGDDPTSILAALRLAEKISADRRTWLRTQGRKEWRATDGPMVTVVVDEMSELARICPPAMELCESLARLSRSAGFQCWFADQYPTADVFPPVVKQNCPITIGHRVKNGTAERVLLGEDATKEGWKISGPLPVGRAVVDLPGIGKQWVQVFPEDGVPEAPSSASTPPTSTPPTQGESPELDTGHWTVDTPELDTPRPKRYKHDDAIENALTGLPRSARDLADEVGCSPTTASQALIRIAAKGRAKAVGEGWVCPYLHELSA